MLVFYLVLAGIVLFFVVAWIISPMPAPPTDFLPMHGPKQYLAPPNWQGTPFDQQNRYVNYESAFYQNYVRILRCFPGHFFNLLRNFRKPFNIVKHNDSSALKSNNSIWWLGHASYLIIIDHVKILTDPQFYNTSFYARHSKNPIEPNWFKDIDYILLSHDHADHCDKRSLDLLIKNNPGVKLLAGLGMDTLSQTSFNFGVEVITAEWYEKYPINNIDVYFVPARHYSHRLFKKFNSVLWGGFMIRTKDAGNAQTIYFGGDSAYGGHYRDLKMVFKPDVVILGVGAYKPRWFLYPVHMSPEDAIKAFADMEATIMLPMHYGTFNLAYEAIDAPAKIFREHNDPAIKILKPGNGWNIGANVQLPLDLPPVKA